MTMGTGPEPTEMIRRLRARPLSSWRHGDREAVMRAALQQLADLAAAGTDGVVRTVPDVGLAGLVDQFVVLLRDAVESGVAGEDLAPLLAELARRLSL